MRHPHRDGGPGRPFRDAAVADGAPVDGESLDAAPPPPDAEEPDASLPDAGDPDAPPPDAPPPDAEIPDAPPPLDADSPDAAVADATVADAAITDAAIADAAIADAAIADAAIADAAIADAAIADAGIADATIADGAIADAEVVTSTSGAGGFVEPLSSTTIRPTLTRDEILAFMPERGPFTFPAPYNTQGARLTNETDCGGADCVDYAGYSYWRNINNHVGQSSMLIFVGLDRARGGQGVTLFRYDKSTGDTTKLGPLFDAGDPRSWYSGEGWSFSATLPTTLYYTEGPRLMRYDVLAKTTQLVFDVSDEYGPGAIVWQAHTSNDDRVHSATLKDASYQPLGCVVYREDTAQLTLYPAEGDFDECQVDKSGRWLLIKENVDGVYGEDNRIIDLDTGDEKLLLDQDGAAGHSDNGFGCMVAEDNWASLPGAVKLWQFSDLTSNTLEYYTESWSVDVGHVSFANARGDIPVASQYACTSHAGDNLAPRANEISCFLLDGSEKALVVAPVMTDLAAPGGGDTYAKLPKGNLDPTGRYMLWTTNLAGDRLDAVIVKVPSELLTGTP